MPTERMSIAEKFTIGQRVWFLKSMRMCRIVEDYGEKPPEGRFYMVEVLDSGRRLFVPAKGLELCEGEDETSAC